ncbi:MAG: squalene/phytoene synthase family protein [Eggerthella lenta]
MQLTNILRDVGEDLENGASTCPRRCWRRRRTCRAPARARGGRGVPQRLGDGGAPLGGVVPPGARRDRADDDSRLPALSSLYLYRGILDEVRADGYRCLSIAPSCQRQRRASWWTKRWRRSRKGSDDGRRDGEPDRLGRLARVRAGGAGSVHPAARRGASSRQPASSCISRWAAAAHRDPVLRFALWAAALPAAFILVNAFAYRRQKLSFMGRDGGEDTLARYYAVSLTALALFSFGIGASYVGALGFFCMAFGDGFAAVLGKRFDGACWWDAVEALVEARPCWR